MAAHSFPKPVSFMLLLAALHAGCALQFWLQDMFAVLTGQICVHYLQLYRSSLKY